VLRSNIARGPHYTFPYNFFTYFVMFSMV